MKRPLTIVMYHYVRPLRESRFPRIKGLDLRLFEEQLAYLQRHYTIVSGQDLLDALAAGDPWALPANAALLTFDDGYIDHYRYVFPRLQEAGVSGCFFPPACAALDRTLLDVNRIHFILAASEEPARLVEDLFGELDAVRAEHALPGNDELYARHAQANRFDPAEVIFFKRMLQRELPPELRGQIARRLFARHVTNDERAFAEELYVGLSDLQSMSRQGMYVGSHGAAHNWLSRVSPDEQRQDVARSLDMLREVGTDTSSWIMCYPYGDWNEALLSTLVEQGCAAGLTTRVGIAAADGNPLLLDRLDTNDLPKDASAPPNAWTQQVRQA